MDFKDWRKSPDGATEEHQAPKKDRHKDKRYLDYIEEQIQEAQARGEFDNLPGAGKPLELNNNPFTGDKALAYSLLKSNGFAPPEIELAKVPPFNSEKRAFNHAVKKAAAEHDQLLLELNRKILNLNLITPSPMHMPMFEVEKLVQQFRESCPLFD